MEACASAHYWVRELSWLGHEVRLIPPARRGSPAMDSAGSAGTAAVPMRRIRLFGTAGAAALLIGTLLLPFVGGYPLAYLLMLMALLLIGYWLAARPRLAELGEPAGLLSAAAFLLIALALAATARAPADLIYAFNFTLFALFPPLRAAMARFAAPGNSAIVAWLALAGTAIALSVAAYQVLVLGYARATGIWSDPIWAAQQALIFGFLALIGVEAIEGRRRLLFLLGPVMGIVAVLLSGSRGPLIAALPLFAMAFILAGRSWRPLLGGLAIAVLCAIVLVALNWPQALMRLRSIGGAASEVAAGSAVSEGSVEVRAWLYRSSWEAFLHSPWVGYGWEQRLAASYGFVPGGAAAIEAADPMMRGNHHLHADLLDFGVGAGLAGVIAYGLVLLSPVVGALASPPDRQRRPRLLGAALLATGYFACGLSYIMFGYEYPGTLFACSAAILLGFCRDAPMAAARP